MSNHYLSILAGNPLAVVAALLAILAIVLLVLWIRARGTVRGPPKTRAAEVLDDSTRLFTDLVTAIPMGVDTETKTNRFLQMACEGAMRTARANGAVLELVEGDMVTQGFASGSSAPFTGRRQHIGSSLEGLCIKTGQPVRSDDTQTDPRVTRAGGTAPPYRSLLVVPLRHENWVAGVLRVMSPRPNAFGELEERALTPAAHLVAATLWRAQEHVSKEALASEAKAAKDRARASEERLAGVLDHLEDVYCVMTADRGQVQYVNPAFERVYGRPADDLYRQPAHWTDAVHPDDRGRLQKAQAKASQGGYDETYRITRPDKSVRWIRERAFPLGPAGAPSHLLSLVQDLTEATRLRQENESLVRRTQHALSSGPAIAYSMGVAQSHGITYVSDNVAQHLGHRPKDFTEDPTFWTAHLHPDEQTRVLGTFSDLFKNGRWTHEYRFKHKDGSYRLLRDDAALVRTPGGEPQEIVGYWVDVTDQKRADEGSQFGIARIKELQDSRTQLLNTIVHDLGGPIMPMTMQIQLLHDALPQPTPEQAKSIGVIERSVENLGRLIEDVRDLARLEAGKLKVDAKDVDLAELVQSAFAAFEPQARERGLHLDLKSDKALPVRADPGRITQVLYNYLGNALKFTPKGGRIHLEAAGADGQVRVRVTDSGRGLTPDEIDRLFKPFSQVHDRSEVKERGTGLGLFICKGLIESHGGSVGVESAGRGKGSTFWFRLPLRK